MPSLLLHLVFSLAEVLELNLVWGCSWLKDLMLWFSSIYPFPLVAPVMYWVTKAGQEVENDGQSIPYTAWFLKCHFSTSERYIPADNPVPLDPNAFTHQVSSVSFFHCHAGLRGVKLLLFKEGFSKVTFSWKHTIANSVSTPDKIVIQLTMVSVLLAWGGKLLLSQLSSLQIWFLPSAHSLIQSLIDVLIMCFRIQSSHDPGLQLCSGQCSEEWSSEWTADNSDIQMQFGTFPGGVMTIMSHRQPLNCLKW